MKKEGKLGLIFILTIFIILPVILNNFTRNALSKNICFKQRIGLKRIKNYSYLGGVIR